MRKLLIVSFLISLVLNTEIELKKKEEEKSLKHKDVNLRSVTLAAAGIFVVKLAASAAIGEIVSKGLDRAHYLITQGHFRDEILENGKARWISNIKGGYVVAMYWHKTRRHSATCDGGFLGGGRKRAVAQPGYWAVAYCKAGVSGRKTFRNNL